MSLSRLPRKSLPELKQDDTGPTWSNESHVAFGRSVPGPGSTSKQRFKKTVNRTGRSLDSQNLSEENAMLRASLQKLDLDYKRMEEELEYTVKEAHERLAHMKTLLETKEANHRTIVDGFSKNNEHLEEQMSKYEGKLIASNIDPVTLETVEPSEAGSQAVEEKKKISKVRVKQMREKLRDMNQKTQTYLEDMQNMKRQLEELEAVSGRMSMGDNSDEENEDDQKRPPPASTLFITQSATTDGR